MSYGIWLTFNHKAVACKRELLAHSVTSTRFPSRAHLIYVRHGHTVFTPFYDNREGWL